jgi:regulator of sigma D
MPLGRSEVASESEEMHYCNLLAVVAYHRGIVALNGGAIEQALDQFWQALVSSIQYNCFLLDKIASEIKGVCKSQADEAIRKVALSGLSKLVDRWATERIDQDSLLSLEIQNRELETNKSYSSLEGILLSA